MTDSHERSKRTYVVGPHGRYRFQTGMVTAALLARGLSMKEAFAASAHLRDELKPLPEVTTDDLEARIEALARAAVGEPGPRTGDLDLPNLLRAGRSQPYSRNRLLRFLVTAGLDAEQALEVAQDVEGGLRSGGGPSVDEASLDAMIGDVVADRFGDGPRRRYELTRAIRSSPRPVVVLLGGATGTGKSTLATELAYRLGISQVTSTDMIRATMRAVLSREVVPGLHDHSFRGMALGGQVLSDPRERVLAGYRQQAEQVAVGVRAVIRRAVREGASLVLEGTHLRPPFHQYIPPDLDVIAAGLVLAVPEAKAHERRFPERAARSLRPPEDYLDSFQAVRWIHDDLMAMGEETGSVVVANESLDDTVVQVVEVLSRVLEFGERQPRAASLRPGSPTLLLILDGLPDVPNPALAGETPMAAAWTPTLDLLASAGGQGLIRTTGDQDRAPETDEGLLALLAGPRLSTKPLGRGLLEALGLGLSLSPDSILFRGNLATHDGGDHLLDRRAGRIRAGQSDLLADLRDVPLLGGLRGSILPTHEHRVVVVLRGPGLSAALSDTDPGSAALVQRIHPPMPTDDSPEAARAAEALAHLLRIARRVLTAHPHNAERVVAGLAPANCVITRGAAAASDLPRPSLPAGRAALVSGCSTAQGVARAVGMESATSSRMTGNLDTDLDAKFAAAAELLRSHTLVAVHFKGTDIAAHDRRPVEKRDFIARVDAALARFLAEHAELAEGLRIVVSADHGTSSVSGDHLAAPVPVLVARWRAGLDDDFTPASFHEESARSGALGLLGPGELSELLWGAELGGSGAGA